MALVREFAASGEGPRTVEQAYDISIPASELQNLPDYKLYVRTLLAGRPLEPVLVQSLPPFSKSGKETNADHELTEVWPRSPGGRKDAQPVLVELMALQVSQRVLGASARAKYNIDDQAPSDCAKRRCNSSLDKAGCEFPGWFILAGIPDPLDKIHNTPYEYNRDTQTKEDQNNVTTNIGNGWEKPGQPIVKKHNDDTASGGH